MRRISLSVLAGVALLGATLVVLHATSVSLGQPTLRTSAQLIAVAPAGLTRAPRRLVDRRSGLKQTLAHLLATDAMLANPAIRRFTVTRRSTIQATPHIQLPLPLSRSCPVATGSSPGGCSIVPCAVYVGAGQASYAVTSSPGAGLAILPSVTRVPSRAGTPAGTCVSRPGRPPQMRWVSSTSR